MKIKTEPCSNYTIDVMLQVNRQGDIKTETLKKRKEKFLFDIKKTPNIIINRIVEQIFNDLS